MNLIRLVLASASASTLLVAASIAHADAPLVSQYETSRVGLATEIWPSTHFAIATMAIEGQFAVAKNAVIDFSFPNWAFGGAAGKGFAEFGGLMIGAHAVGHVDRDIALWGGFELTIPTTWKNVTNLAQGEFDIGAAETRALFDLGRTLPETLTLKFPLGAEMKFDFVYIRPSLALPIYIPVGDNNAKTEVALETAVELEARHPIGFGGGLRFQAIVELTDSGDLTDNRDRAQTALEPFIGYEGPGDKLGAYARLGLLFALDTPLGFGFDQGKLAAIDIKVGGKF